MSDDTRTLLVTEQSGNQFRITIPSDYKVTFGSKGGNRGFGENELRIYEAESKQRACFVGVRSFRDLSLPLERLVIEESGEETWEQNENGYSTSRKVKRSQKVVAG